MSSPSSPVIVKRGRPSLKRRIEKKVSSPAPSNGLRGVFVYKKDDEITWGIASNITEDAAEMENGDIVKSGDVIKNFSQSFQHNIAVHIDEQDRPFHPKRLLIPHTYSVVGSRGKIPVEARQACMEAIQYCRDHPLKIRGRGTSKSQLEKEIASLKRQLEKQKGN